MLYDFKNKILEEVYCREKFILSGDCLFFLSSSLDTSSRAWKDLAVLGRTTTPWSVPHFEGIESHNNSTMQALRGSGGTQAFALLG